LKDALTFNHEPPASENKLRGIQGDISINVDKLPAGGGKLSSVENNKQYVIVVGLAEKRAGIVVNSIKSQREVLIKPLNELLGDVPEIAGFTEIDSKNVVPVIDVGWLIEECKI
jgi:two-component system chemotaxis sensor kinase CheA